jgi:hypothetical protein
MDRKLLLISSAILLSISSSIASDLVEKEKTKDRNSVTVTSDEITTTNGAGALVTTNQQLVEEEEQADTTLCSATKNVLINGNYKELKALDQLGNKIVGQHAKTFVEKNVPFGSEITTVTGFIAKKIDPTADTLTEVVVKKVRSPLKLDEEKYPETKEGIIGHKAKKAVEKIPVVGGMITAVTGRIGKACFGTDTLVEGVVKKFSGSSANQQPQGNATPQVQIVEIDDAEPPQVSVNKQPQVLDIDEEDKEEKKGA